MRGGHVLITLVLAASVQAHHGDILLTYVEAGGRFHAGLVAVGVGAPDDGDPVPPAGVGAVNMASFPFEADLCHLDLQVLLRFEPKNATVALPGAFVEAPYEFQLELFDATSGERLPGSTMRFRSSPAEGGYALGREMAGVPLRADLYLLRGADTEWDLSIRGWPDPSVPCTQPPVINEVEANPDGVDAGREWVEIYNPNLVPVDVSGWTVRATRGTPASLVLGDVVVAAQGRVVVTFSEGQAIDNVDEVVVLEDASGVEQDRTPALSDGADDGRTNQRTPDGGWATWAFLDGTRDAPNAAT